MTDNPFPKLPHKDLVSAGKLTPDEVRSIFNTALELKAGRDVHTRVLENKRVAMIFEKDSLRTRFTFDIGIQDMGGTGKPSSNIFLEKSPPNAASFKDGFCSTISCIACIVLLLSFTYIGERCIAMMLK